MKSPQLDDILRYGQRMNIQSSFNHLFFSEAMAPATIGDKIEYIL